MPRSRLIAIFRISTVPFGRTTPTEGFPELKSNVREHFKPEVVHEVTKLERFDRRRVKNPHQKQFLDAISIRARSYERDLAFGRNLGD